MSMRPVFLSVLALLLITHTAPAAADFSIDKKLWMPVGINFGYTWTDPTNDGQSQDSAFLGAEISFVMTLESSLWSGVYFDVIALLDADAAQARLSFGPEIGFAIFGLDGGYVAEFYDGKVSTGFQARFLLYYLLGGIYFRAGALWNDEDDARGLSEVGVLLKIPFN